MKAALLKSPHCTDSQKCTIKGKLQPPTEVQASNLRGPRGDYEAADLGKKKKAILPPIVMDNLWDPHPQEAVSSDTVTG